MTSHKFLNDWLLIKFNKSSPNPKPMMADDQSLQIWEFLIEITRKIRNWDGRIESLLSNIVEFSVKQLENEYMSYRPFPADIEAISFQNGKDQRRKTIAIDKRSKQWIEGKT